MDLRKYNLELVETGLEDVAIELGDVESVSENRIKLNRKFEYVADGDLGGTEVASNDEFDFEFTKRESSNAAYILLTKKEGWVDENLIKPEFVIP